MFHHIPDLPGGPQGYDGLVSATNFIHSQEEDPATVRHAVYGFLESVVQSAFRRNGAVYERRSFPPIEFEYTKAVVQDAVEDVDRQSVENLPVGVDDGAYRWTDLHGEGVTGLTPRTEPPFLRYPYVRRGISPARSYRRLGAHYR
jgi:hypothetical protein